MVRNRTVDDSVTYWFPSKHPTARQRWLEFGIFDQAPWKWARLLGPTGLADRSSFFHKTTTAKASVRLFGPCHSSLLAPLHETTSQMWARLCGVRLSSVANAPGANFSPFRCPVSDMLRSTSTTLSVMVKDGIKTSSSYHTSHSPYLGNPLQTEPNPCRDFFRPYAAGARQRCCWTEWHAVERLVRTVSEAQPRVCLIRASTAPVQNIHQVSYCCRMLLGAIWCQPINSILVCCVYIL